MSVVEVVYKFWVDIYFEFWKKICGLIVEGDFYVKEFKCLIEVIYYEVWGEGVIGWFVVVEVVINWKNDDWYLDMICGVVY